MKSVQLCSCFLLGLSAHAGTVVQFRTTFGDLLVELLDTEKPITVQNFLRYIDEGLYTDGFFHRSVHNFVLQGGGFAITNRNTTNSSVTAIKTYPEILNEFKVGPLVSNTRGTIAMAKTSDPNSATSQFFVNLANNAASLDDTNNSGGFSVFGNVISGTNLFDVLNSFIGSTTIYTNVLVNAGGVFRELPVLSYPKDHVATKAELIANLVFVDITRLNIHIESLADGTRGIAWDSTRGVTNTVEFTTQMPPVWQTLTSFAPTEIRTQVVDSATTASNRFYRVRILR